VVEMKPFPMDVRNKLVNSGRVSVHHFLTQSERVNLFRHHLQPYKPLFLLTIPHTEHE
jgi:hypothetical protein